MRVILVNGRKGCGKDTFADILIHHLMLKGYNVAKIGNADYVRELARDRYNWDGVKDNKGRQLLLDVTQAGYNYDPFFFEKITYARAKKQQLDIVVIPDWRYEATYTYMCEEVGHDNVITVRVQRDKTTINTPTLDNHVSEIGLDTFEFNHTVTNKGTILDLDSLVNLYVANNIFFA